MFGPSGVGVGPSVASALIVGAARSVSGASVGAVGVDGGREGDEGEEDVLGVHVVSLGSWD